jgi:hypothetical protein
MSTPFGNSASVAGTGEFVLAQVAISPLAEAGTEITAAYTEPVQEGSVLVAYAVRSAGLFVSCPAVETVFDSQSNKWKQAGEGTVATSNDRGLDIWYCDKAKASAPPIVTARAAHFPSNAYTGMHLTVLEYAGGCGGLECLESVGFAHAGDATATVTTLDTVTAGDLLVSGVAGDAAGTGVVSGWNKRVGDSWFGCSLSDREERVMGGSPASATWTGMTGQTEGYAMLCAFRYKGTRSATQSHCLQMQYHAAWITGGAPTRTAISPPYHVDPVAGNTLVAVVTPNGGSTLRGLVDDQGNSWTKIGDMGADTTGGIQTTIWATTNCHGSSPRLTGSLDNPIPDGTCSWTLLEYANVPSTMVLADGHSLMYPATANPSVSTSAPVPAGARLALCYINGEYGSFDGLRPSAGWRPRLMDSQGSGGLAEMLSPPAGTLRHTWHYNSSQGGSTFLVVI